MDIVNFGACCMDLRQAMIGVPHSFFHVEGEILYLTVGSAPREDGQTDWFEIPVFHCPFCGKKIQDRYTVERSLAGKPPY
ncbi:MAG: hypothetical protein WCF84_11305 [Anaerolineae bacterium]